jgi:hypothetical protein
LTVGAITERSLFLPPFFQVAGTVVEQQPLAGTALATPVPVGLVVIPALPTWAIVLPLALLGAALALATRRRTTPRGGPEPPEPLPLILRSHVSADRGDQQMQGMNPMSLEIRVRHTTDRGRHSVREVEPPPDRRGIDGPGPEM